MKKHMLMINEQIINFYKPARHMPEDKVFLCERTLEDKSQKYAVIIGNVRFDCTDMKQALKLYNLISKEITDFNIY